MLGEKYASLHQNIIARTYSPRREQGWKGRLGHGSEKDTEDLVGITTFDSQGMMVRDVATYNVHTLVIDENFHLWSAGDNEYGQLGHGNTREKNEVNFVGVEFVKNGS